MIKIFRRLRQQLMAENKSSTSAEASVKAGRYFKYAIGEIILVVIGILIALQINNWNENQKKVKREIQLLKEIQGALAKDASAVFGYTKTLEIPENAIKNILKELDNNTYSDSLNSSFADALWRSEWPTNDAAYETIKSEGLTIISNDTLRQDIIKLYEQTHPLLHTLEKNFFMDHQQFLQHCSKLFDNVSFIRLNNESIFGRSSSKPHSIQELRKDKLYKTLLNSRLSEIQHLKDFVISHLQPLYKRLLASIDTEVKRLEK